jgi:hypothetical protein
MALTLPVSTQRHFRKEPLRYAHKVTLLSDVTSVSKLQRRNNKQQNPT